MDAFYEWDKTPTVSSPTRSPGSTERRSRWPGFGRAGAGGRDRLVPDPRPRRRLRSDCDRGGERGMTRRFRLPPSRGLQKGWGDPSTKSPLPDRRRRSRGGSSLRVHRHASCKLIRSYTAPCGWFPPNSERPAQLGCSSFSPAFAIRCRIISLATPNQPRQSARAASYAAALWAGRSV